MVVGGALRGGGRRPTSIRHRGRSSIVGVNLILDLDLDVRREEVMKGHFLKAATLIGRVDDFTYVIHRLY